VSARLHDEDQDVRRAAAEALAAVAEPGSAAAMEALRWDSGC
jgi:HEAT repeat protein